MAQNFLEYFVSVPSEEILFYYIFGNRSLIYGRITGICTAPKGEDSFRDPL
jgi:hypothetical protein